MLQRVAIIADVHANLPALTTALAAIDAARCDAVYCLGDVIGIGPCPAECLDLLLGIPSVRFVIGNHDAWFARGLPDPHPSWMGPGEAAHHRWTHAQLDPALRTVVARWPFVREEVIGPVQATFLHYALDATGRDFAPIVPAPTPAELDALFGACRTPLVFYGHHHPTADAIGKARYLNPGSLGCSPDPVARFSLLAVGRDGTFRLEHRAVPYNRDELVRQFAERRVPERAFLLQAFFGRPPAGAA